MTPPILCGLILAAGESSRMGRDKALLPWPAALRGAHTTLLAASIRALQPLVQQVVVVAGTNEDSLAPIAAECGAVLVRNPAPERGQFSSLQIGLRCVLDLGFDAVALTPVDAPPLAPSTLALLRAAFERALARGLWALAPEHAGRHGHPLLAARPLIEAFLSAPVSANTRLVREAHAPCIQHLPVDDSLVGVEMNTPRDYDALLACLAAQPRSGNS